MTIPGLPEIYDQQRPKAYEKVVASRRWLLVNWLTIGSLASACGGGGESSSPPPVQPAPPPPPPPISNPPFVIAGFNINLYGRNSMRGVNYRQSLDNIVQTGSNTVMVTTPYFQNSATSSDVHADDQITDTDQNLAELFDAILARGLTAAYKFTLIPKDETWSGAIEPSDPDAWFAAYQSHLVRIAGLAQAHGVTLLYIANEMQSMAGSRYSAKWQALVQAVRGVYSGRLSWNAVLNARAFPNGEAFQIPVVSQLDHIGLSAYEPLTDKMNPTVAELQHAWHGNRQGHDLVSMIKTLNQRTDKPIVFSELCYRFVDGYNRDPADWVPKPSDVLDPQEQADCYEAFLRVWTAEAQPWMHGVLWWQWSVDPTPGPRDAADQSPQGKPAQAVVTKWFTGAPR